VILKEPFQTDPMPSNVTVVDTVFTGSRLPRTR
jgi:hypothetical protein